MKPLGTTTLKNPIDHKCTLCTYSTKFPHNYQRHLLIHSSEKPFKCPKCQYKTKLKQNLKCHLKTMHERRPRTDLGPFPCPHSGCKYTTKRKSALIKHSKIHSGENMIFCRHPGCKFSTHQKGKLIIHTRLHTGEKPFVCQFESCSFASTNPSNLVKHLRTHTKERPFKCPEPNCEYSATQSGRLKEHQLTHPPKEGEEHLSFPCPLCEYKGKSKIHLSKHIKSHTLEKLFKCDEPNCTFEARTKTAVKSHKHVHSDERPYKCELCPFRGKTRRAVLKHYKNVHTNFRPFKCTEPQCESAFKTSGNLKVHLLFHKGEKKYSCSFADCNYKAVTKHLITQHEYKVHSDEKKEKCVLCDYRCKTKDKMTTHIRTHTKEEPYFCQEKRNGCEYRAKSLSALKYHLITVHPDLFNE